MFDDVRNEIEELELDLWADVQALANELENRGQALQPGAEGRAEYFMAAGDHWEMEKEYDRAIVCFAKAVEDGGRTTINAKAALIGGLFDAGRVDEAEAALAELRRDAREGRAGGVLHEYVGETLELHGRPGEALRWFNAALTYVDLDRPEALDRDAERCLMGRWRVRRAMDEPLDRLDELAREVIAMNRAGRLPENQRSYDVREVGANENSSDSPGRSVAVIAVMHWPDKEYEALLARWPQLREQEYGDTAAEHRGYVERTLRRYAAALSPLALSPGTVEEYVDYAHRSGQDPAESASRASYAAEVARQGRTIPWPPGRNDPCWCGSGTKYKRCCGALRFPETEE